MSTPELDGKAKKSDDKDKNVLHHQCLRKTITHYIELSSLFYNTILIVTIQMPTLHLQLAIKNEKLDLSNNFNAVMELERRRYKWMKLGEAQLVSCLTLLVECVQLRGIACIV